jgi:hypothetical protein
LFVEKDKLSALTDILFILLKAKQSTEFILVFNWGGGGGGFVIYGFNIGISNPKHAVLPL